MNARVQYEMRGWAYWARCLNPLRNTITIGNLPLGIKLRAYKRDAVGRGLYRRKIHEPSLTQLLLNRFSNSAQRNFIDAGANIGYFTCLMSNLAAHPELSWPSNRSRRILRSWAKRKTQRPEKCVALSLRPGSHRRLRNVGLV